MHPRHRLIFVDEFGFNLAMTPAYARAPRGQRAYSDVPFNPGRNLTLTVGLRVTGTIAPFVVPGATDGDSFTAYIETQLVPHVRRGNVVLVDDLGAHRVAAARAILKARGARLELLPPYSPDFNPVEACGSKIKTFVRRAKPQSERKLINAIGRAWATVTPRDARAWFDHYGYRGKLANARRSRQSFTRWCAITATRSSRTRVKATRRREWRSATRAPRVARLGESRHHGEDD